MAKHLLLPFITLILFFSTYNRSTAQSNTIGLSGGIAFIDGDVQHRYDQGYSIGIHFSENFKSYLSFEGRYYFGSTWAIDTEPTLFTTPFTGEFPELWFANYKTNFQAIHMGLGLRKSIGSYEVKLTCGVGFMSYNSKTNYLDNNGMPYQNLADQVRIEGSSYDLDKLHSILDDTFEFDVDEYDSEIVRIGRNFNIYFSQIIAFQLSRKFTDKFSVGLSAEITRAGVDSIDSIEYRGVDFTNLTNDRDDYIHRWSLESSYHF